MASDLVLHGLPMSHIKDAMLIWANGVRATKTRHVLPLAVRWYHVPLFHVLVKFCGISNGTTL